jgi:hypothetical protein
MADETADAPQRWTAKRRVALVVSILKEETSVPAAARKHGLTVAEIEELRERFLLGAENALRARPKDEDTLKDEHNQEAQAEDRRARPGPGHPEGGHGRPPFDSHSQRVPRATTPTGTATASLPALP